MIVQNNWTRLLEANFEIKRNLDYCKNNLIQINKMHNAADESVNK